MGMTQLNIELHRMVVIFLFDLMSFALTKWQILAVIFIIIGTWRIRMAYEYSTAHGGCRWRMVWNENENHKYECGTKAFYESIARISNVLAYDGVSFALANNCIFSKLLLHILLSNPWHNIVFLFFVCNSNPFSHYTPNVCSCKCC